MTQPSYVCDTSDKPLLFKTIGRAIEDAADTWGTHEALVVCHQNIGWTYKELLAEVDAFSAGLIHLGLKPGDRVGVWSPHNAEWVIARFATARPKGATLSHHNILNNGYFRLDGKGLPIRTGYACRCRFTIVLAWLYQPVQTLTGRKRRRVCILRTFARRNGGQTAHPTVPRRVKLQADQSLLSGKIIFKHRKSPLFERFMVELVV